MFILTDCNFQVSTLILFYPESHQPYFTFFSQVPLLSPVSGDGDADAGQVGQHVASSEPARRRSFAFGKHLPDIFNRLVLEVAGAQFVMKLVKSSGKRAAASSVEGAEGDVVDVVSLLQPKKKAKRANPKKKATGTGTSTGGGSSGQGGEQEGAEQLTREVEMATGGVEGSRARWWIDDVFACLAHAAGGYLSKVRSCLALHVFCGFLHGAKSSMASL